MQQCSDYRGELERAAHRRIAVGLCNEGEISGSKALQSDLGFTQSLTWMHWICFFCSDESGVNSPPLHTCSGVAVQFGNENNDSQMFLALQIGGGNLLHEGRN